MRLLTVLLLAVATLIPLAAHAVQDCELNGEAVNPANGNTTAGKTGLMRCKDRDSGQMRREQELKNGKFMGLVRHYQDGRLFKEHSVNEQGNMDGRAREFAANGQVVYDTTYENGRRTGLLRAWYDSGKPRRAAFNENDREIASVEWSERGQVHSLRCGDRPVLSPAADDRALCGFAAPSQVEMFSDSGVLQTRSTWVQGKRTRYETFFRNGQPQTQQEVSASGRVERRFADDGTKRREIRWESSGAADARAYKVLEQDYSERGTLVREQRWAVADGSAVSDVSFYLNGQPKAKTEFSKEGEQQVRRESGFYDSGKLASEGRFVETGRFRTTQPVGSHRRYDESGRVAAESVYDDRGRLTREKVWDEAGQLVRDDEVFEDGSRKSFAR
ncbi:MAG: hypothetical protein J0H69_15000 [Burkholderiales bacterium]|nr:hypothetical protein [Burkholderiales bacterium]